MTLKYVPAPKNKTVNVILEGEDQVSFYMGISTKLPKRLDRASLSQGWYVSKGLAGVAQILEEFSKDGFTISYEVPRCLQKSRIQDFMSGLKEEPEYYRQLSLESRLELRRLQGLPELKIAA